MGETRSALDLAERIVTLGGQIGDDGVEIVGHRIHALTVHAMGDLSAARAELESVLAAYAPERHGRLGFQFGQDARIAATAILSTVLWGLGYPDHAIRTSTENAERALALKHTNSLAYSFAYGACIVAVLRGEEAEALRLAQRLIDLATEHRLHLWRSYGEAYKGWALARQGATGEAVSLLEGALAGFVRAGSGLYWPLMLGMTGYALDRAGRHADALARIEEAVRESERREEIWCLPELLRLQARMLRRRDGPDAAAPLLHRALGLTRSHLMRGWELRVSCDLAALLREMGEVSATQSLLQQVLANFPEQSDTPDRRRALALLGRNGTVTPLRPHGAVA
jgi:predicted ATPase